MPHRSVRSWSDRRIAALLFVGAMAMYGFGNGRTSLWDRDEPRFAQPAKEMIAADTLYPWIVPHYNGEPFFHKPPWCYWQIAAAYKLLGVSEFAARFFSGLWAAGAVVLVFFFSRRWGHQAAIAAALATATALLTVVLAKLAIADATLLFFTLAAVFALWRIIEGGNSAANRFALWTALGIAGLIKGPAVLVVIVPLAIGFAIVDRDRSWLRRMGLAWGPALALAIALPWFVTADRFAEGALTERFVGYDIIQRILKPAEGHRGFPGYYVISGLIGLWPWSALLVPLGLTVWRLRSERVVRFAFCWLVAPTLVLELMATKMVHYWLPMVPAYALLLGLALQRWRSDWPAIWRRWVRPVQVAALLGYALLAAVICAASRNEHAGPLADAFLPAIPLLLLLPAALFLIRDPFRLVGGLAAVAALIAAVLSWTAATVEPYKLTHTAAVEMKQIGGPQALYALAGWDEESMIFYLHDGKQDVRIVAPDALAKLPPDTPVVAAVRADRLPAGGIEGFQEIARVNGYDYTRGKWRQVVILQRPGKGETSPSTTKASGAS
ncbi:MAG: glycosyltransferase family 39 protein [Phycisphaerae bacterium]|nr:glycosyltransferase family 39 protein [Phycisphaerae bacterium]